MSSPQKTIVFKNYLEAWMHQQRRGRKTMPIRVPGAHITGHLWAVKL